MPEENSTITVKKIYSKPQVIEVRLVAEEAVLADCKFGNGILADCEGHDLICNSGPTS